MVALGPTAQRTFRTTKVNIWYVCKLVGMCNQHYNDYKPLRRYNLINPPFQWLDYRITAQVLVQFY